LIVEFVFDFFFKYLNMLSEFLSTNYHALPAPSLWFVLMMFLLWYCLKSRSNAPPVHLLPPSHTHCCLLVIQFCLHLLGRHLCCCNVIATRSGLLVVILTTLVVQGLRFESQGYCLLHSP
jgi:hypothetical protein